MNFTHSKCTRRANVIFPFLHDGSLCREKSTSLARRDHLSNNPRRKKKSKRRVVITSLTKAQLTWKLEFLPLAVLNISSSAWFPLLRAFCKKVEARVEWDWNFSPNWFFQQRSIVFFKLLQLRNFFFNSKITSPFGLFQQKKLSKEVINSDVIIYFFFFLQESFIPVKEKNFFSSHLQIKFATFQTSLNSRSLSKP